jgi:hypothetical protein
VALHHPSISTSYKLYIYIFISITTFILNYLQIQSRYIPAIMTSNIETLKLRIAIVGGGLAGATLMNALTNYPHLDVNIYESAPEFSERGAAVGLSENAQRAMSELGPNVREALGRAGAVQMNSTRFVIVRLSKIMISYR